MKELVANFTSQLQESLLIGQKYKFTSEQKQFSNVVLTGLGGSGIGGSIVQNYVHDKIKIPFVVNKDYFLPNFVGKDSLVIVSSYSGNTEETLAAMNQAIKAKATVVCITSGGNVAEIAKKKNLDCIIVPGGMPPRACLGFSLIQQLFVLAHFKLIKKDFEASIRASIEMLDQDEEAIKKQANAIAKKLNGTTPIIYAEADFEGVAVRFRQQINENSKMLCWHNVIPEMNHNELVGWRDKDNSRAVILLRNEDDYERTQIRMEINKTVIKKYTKNFQEIWSKGATHWEKVFFLVHLTDWVSVILADLHGMDASEIKVINMLKGELAKK